MGPRSKIVKAWSQLFKIVKTLWCCIPHSKNSSRSKKSVSEFRGPALRSAKAPYGFGQSGTPKSPHLMHP